MHTGESIGSQVVLKNEVERILDERKDGDFFYCCNNHHWRSFLLYLAYDARQLLR
jgi:hypothetical protein